MNTGLGTMTCVAVLISSPAVLAPRASAQSGVPLWTNLYHGPGNGADGANAIAVDQNGNVFVTGVSYGAETNAGYATVAYSNAGVPLWTNRYNGPGNGSDFAKGIAVDKNGNVF